MAITAQEIKDIILSCFICKSETMHNCASIVIYKETIEIYPRSGYNMTDYVDAKLLYEAEKRGFDYCNNLSDKDQLVFIMK